LENVKVQCVNSFQYVGVNFYAATNLTDNIEFVTENFYAAFSSVTHKE